MRLGLRGGAIKGKTAAAENLLLPAEEKHIAPQKPMPTNCRLAGSEQRDLKSGLLDATDDIGPKHADMVALAEMEQPVGLGGDAPAVRRFESPGRDESLKDEPPSAGGPL